MPARRKLDCPYSLLHHIQFKHPNPYSNYKQSISRFIKWNQLFSPSTPSLITGPSTSTTNQSPPTYQTFTKGSTRIFSPSNQASHSLPETPPQSCSLQVALKWPSPNPHHSVSQVVSAIKPLHSVHVHCQNITFPAATNVPVAAQLL